MTMIILGNRQVEMVDRGTDYLSSLHAVGRRVRAGRLAAIEDGELGSLRQADLRRHNCVHEWACTGAAYGGDDDRWCGEGRMYCTQCGADGDA